MKIIDKQLLLGIDIGTTGCKCTLYDLNGLDVATSYQDYEMHHLNSGWVEENPKDWWDACIKNINELWTQEGINPEDVASIGVSCTNSIIPVGKNNTVLYNAIMQIDQRTIGQVEWIRKNIGEKKIFEITGNRVAPGTFSLPTMLWLKENHPDIFADTHKFLVPGGLIVWHLTDKFTIDTSRMATTLLGNVKECKWDEELAELAGIPLSKLPDIHNSFDIVGEVTKKAADLTGLIAGTPVVAGAMDTVAAAVGSSAIDPETSFLTIGTCARLCITVNDADKLDDRFLNCPSVYPNQWLSIAVSNSAGASMRWFRDNLSGEEVRQAIESGGSGYEEIDNEVMLSKLGADSVLYLPYLSGERSPIWDPYARGVFFGMSLSTERKDIARSMMEGTGFALKQTMNIWKESGVKSEKLSISGGGAMSKVWPQIIADILQEPLYRLNTNETETLGAALLAGMGVGLIKDPNQITSSMISYDDGIKPCKENSDTYEKLFALYNSVYENLKDDFFKLEKFRSLE